MTKRFIWLFLIITFVDFSRSRNAEIGSYLINENALEAHQYNNQIAVVGDLQRTSVWESMIGRESNDTERVLLINEIAKDNPYACVILGDMVFDGSDREAWRSFDNLIQPLRDLGVNLWPVLGNHEFWGINRTGMYNVQARFPQFKKERWYTKKFNNLAFIFLDSNNNDMTLREWQNQEEWFAEQLDRFDANPAVRGIFVFLHHPPYSNSTLTGDNQPVQLNFIPAFLKSEKSLAMIAGHSHTYERFFKNNKMFIVSGGGGGPRVPLNVGGEFHTDLYTADMPRPFHYLTITSSDSTANILVKGLNKGEENFFVMEKILFVM